jgi:hypothetical protein
VTEGIYSAAKKRLGKEPVQDTVKSQDASEVAQKLEQKRQLLLKMQELQQKMEKEALEQQELDMLEKRALELLIKRLER